MIKVQIWDYKIDLSAVALTAKGFEMPSRKFRTFLTKTPYEVHYLQLSLKVYRGDFKMALSAFEIKRYSKAIEKFLDKRRPSVHIREQVDLKYKFENQSIIIFEIRPQYNDPSKITETPFAKITYIKDQNVWKIYWCGANLKWSAYTPNHIAKNIDDAIIVLDQDSTGCFFG